MLWALCDGKNHVLSALKLLCLAIVEAGLIKVSCINLLQITIKGVPAQTLYLTLLLKINHCCKKIHVLCFCWYLSVYFCKKNSKQ